MSLCRPFYRIIRPFPNGHYDNSTPENEYYLDKEYAPDRSALVRAYHIIEADLLELFNYVEPCDDNLSTYSHRAYELLLRASTEFEANCKSILAANGYINPHGRDLKITDYFKLDRASKLSEYRVVLAAWIPDRKVFEPFKEWNSGATLKWYQSYNTVKHNRSTDFREASLGNVMASVAGLLATLFSQFYINAFDPYRRIEMYDIDDDGAVRVDQSVFQVIPPSPSTWAPDELYDFDWDKVRNSTERFARFPFND